ncbi:alpha-2-antiplasmin isoform X2 [Trachemys scripta elegans]|uniref:alpha-2-antiplasmin isoform X2 n=2 Tax=Trachemys scripta elegans TaxID=31138 RepID=UPI001551E37F|nr:alpha-2-antiplasmin isoform X2 [Trachemys scripta elegans]
MPVTAWQAWAGQGASSAPCRAIGWVERVPAPTEMLSKPRNTAMLLWGLLLCFSTLHDSPGFPLAHALEMKTPPSDHAPQERPEGPAVENATSKENPEWDPSAQPLTSQHSEEAGALEGEPQFVPTTTVLPGVDPTLPNAAVSDSTSDTWEDIHGATLPLPTTSSTTSPGAGLTSSGGHLVTGTVGDHKQVLEVQEVDSSEEEGEGQERGCDMSQEQTRRLAEGLMKFTIDLLTEVQMETSRPNVILSPLSITLALSQLALGAANQTEKRLLEALHLESVPCLHHLLSSIRRQLTGSMLSVASRIYLQKGFEVKEKFLETSERFYGAKPVTLSGNNENDLIAINKWIKEATEGQISTFLDQLPASTVMLLLNAVHFQGFWRHKFDPSQTGPDVFHLDDQFIVPVEMMKAQKYSLSWFTLDPLEVQVARFPFKGNMSFVAIVPNQFKWNVSQVLANLSHDKLHSRFPKEKPTMVKMPKLHVDYQLELNQVLSQLGLRELFSAPDLQKITDEPLFVSSIQHQSTLELAEDGVEASAATSVMMSRSLSTFSLNQPFLFIIFEETTGIPLFVGSIQNPNPSAAQQKKEPQDSPNLKNGIKNSIPK